MTSGERLKQLIGLTKFTNIRMARVLVSPLKIFFIWMDSIRPTMPITTSRVKRFPYTAMLYHGTDLSHEKENPVPVFAPLINIEEYNGTIENALFIVVDMAGNNLIKKNSYSRIFKASKIYKSKCNLLQEYVTMVDLMDTGNISPFTMDFRVDRSMIMGGENTRAKLLDVFLNEPDNSVTFLFQTKATEYNPGKSKKLRRPPAKRYLVPKQRTQPLNLSLIDNPENQYEIQIKLLRFFDWLEVFEGEKIGRKEIKEIFTVSNIQLFSSSPSWQYQGFNYWASEIDGSIYPTDIAPKRWNHVHGDGEAFLDKHLYGLIRNIRFWYQPMSSMLNKKLHDEGYL